MESRSGVPEKVQEIEGSALAVRKVCPAKTPFDPIYSAFIFTKSIMPPRSFPITKLPRSGPLYRARDALLVCRRSHRRRWREPKEDQEQKNKEAESEERRDEATRLK